MSTDSAHKSGWQIFEVIFGVPFLAAIVLQIAVPISIPRGVFTPIFILEGAALIIVGVIIIVLARRQFDQYGQPTDPGHPTTRIVTTGDFSLSRNPFYLGGVCVLAGIALTANLPWALIHFSQPWLPAITYLYYPKKGI